MTGSSLTIGDVNITPLLDADSAFFLPLEESFPGTTPEDWAPFQQRYPDTFTDGRWRLHVGCYLVRSQGVTVLVDTGIGKLMSGRLLDALGDGGVAPADIDLVFLTHLHIDHTGANITDGRPTFPNARYVVHRADWDAFQEPGMKAHAPFPYVDEQITPLRDLGVLDLIDGVHDLTGELAALPTPGHTPGHTSVRIDSRGERAVLIGDVAVHPAQITEPEWCFMFELDPTSASGQRRAFFGDAAREDLLLLACHFPGTGIGKVVEGDDGRRWWLPS